MIKILSTVGPPLILAAILSACGGGSSTAPTPDPKPNTPQLSASQIAGTVGGDHLLAGKVVLGNAETLSFTNTGTLDGAGALALTLSADPEKDTLFTLIPSPSSGCSYSGSGDHAVQVSYWSKLVVLSSQGDFLGTVEQQRTDQTFSVPHRIVRVYSTGSSAFKGTIACSDGFQMTLDLSLSPGWNVAESFSTSGLLTLQNLTAPATAELIGTAQPPRVAVYPDTTQLNFTTDTISVPTLFFQNGGYNGTVHLSTDNDLLTVEPATVTLPALAAQKRVGALPLFTAMGLGQQRLETALTFKLGGDLFGPVSLIMKDDQGKELDRTQFYVTSTLPGFSMSVYTDFTTVLPGSTLPLSVNLSGRNGFSGKVDITAQDPPAGLSVTPTSVTLSQGYVTGQITVNAASTLLPGTYTLKLLGTSGSARATTSVTITVPAPTIAMTATGVTVYGGEQTSMPVTVTGVNNFAGSATLSLSGLPAGVTANSKTVTLTKNGAVSTTLVLTGDTTLLSGTTQTTLTATAQNVMATQPVTLSTRVKRTLLGRYRTVGLGPALDGGFWYVRQDEGSAIYPVLNRFDGTKAADTVTLKNNNGYIYVNVLPIPGGGVWLPGVGGAPLFKYSNSTLKYWDAGFGWDNPPAVDAQGRLWAVVFQNSTSRHVIARFNEASSSFEGVADLSWSSLSKILGSSRDGTVMAGYDSDKSELVTVNTTTLTVKRTSATGFSFISNIAVDASGTGWIYGTLPNYSAGIGQVGADGTVSITPLPSPFGFSPQVFAFDASGVLWVAGSGFAGSFTPLTGALRSITVPQDSYPSYTLNQAGGLWQVWTDNSGNTYASLYK